MRNMERTDPVALRYLGGDQRTQSEQVGACLVSDQGEASALEEYGGIRLLRA